MYVGNLMLLILNLPLIGLWSSCSRSHTRSSFLSSSSSASSVVFHQQQHHGCGHYAGFGVIGYLMKKVSLEAAPWSSPSFSPHDGDGPAPGVDSIQGSFSIFFLRPISATCLILAIALMVYSPTPLVPGGRGFLEQEDVK